MRRIVFVALLVLGCGGAGREETSKAATDLLKEVSTEVREKSLVTINVKASAEEPTPEDLQLRKAIEDAIEQQGIGRLVSASGGSGQMEVTVEVENSAEAIPRLREILRTLEVLPRAGFRTQAGS